MSNLVGSILEHLLSMATAPLFAAAATRKKKQVRKPVRKKAKPARAKQLRVKKPTRRAKPSAQQHAAGAKAQAPTKKKAAERPKVAVSPTPAVKPAEPEPPPKPVPPAGRAILLSPENEKFADSVHPTFRWLSVGGATRYEVTWSEEPNFAQAYSIISIATEATVPVEKPLQISTTHFWRVRGGNESGWGPWSASASFRVLAEEG